MTPNHPVVEGPLVTNPANLSRFAIGHTELRANRYRQSQSIVATGCARPLAAHLLQSSEEFR